VRDLTSTATILIVDDDTTIRIPPERALSNAGMQVVVARDGAEGYAKFLQYRPDIIVSDIQMPFKNGYELCLEIRGTDDGQLVPILMMTGSEGFESVEKSYEFGATDFITKPINYQVLVNRVRYMLRARQTFLELKRSQNQLESLGRVLDNSASEVYFLDSDTHIIKSANKASINNLGYSEQHLYQCTLPSLFDTAGTDTGAILNALSELRSGTLNFYRCASRMRREDGSVYPVEGHIYASKNLSDTSIVCIFEDITQREKYENRMKQLAYYDTLTHLPNRVLFVEHFQTALETAQQSNANVGFLFVDLDNFKYVNDTLGHKAGDELLVLIAGKLEACINARSQLFCGNQNLARFGGDEFAILVNDFKEIDDLKQLAEAIIEALAQPCVINEREIITTPSIGIVVAPEHGSDSDILLQRADVAMYEAKKQGKSGYRLYSEHLHIDGLARIELVRELHLALSRQEFQLVFQPKFEIRSRRIIGFEALIRWHRHGQAISPGVFIPLAEESNLIWDIGDWVINEACRQIREWHAQGVDPSLSLAINLSTKQFSDPDLYASIAGALQKHGVPPTTLQLEITETAFMASPEAVAETLNRLKSLGCSIALDDFGTGYSSLGYLVNIPLDILKIDKSFIDRIDTGSSNSIISTIVALASNLDLKTVAEGVSTEEQLAFIRELDIDYLQGFLWGKPMSKDDATALLLATTAEAKITS
jgi:diguanylate cyclase (GGDEF)-like protein/PAS domain S-box-containing protein